MREFQSEEDFQEFLESGDFFEGDFAYGRRCYLLVCEERRNTTVTLFTDKEFDAYMDENVCVSERDLVERLLYQIGRQCAVTLGMYTVNGNTLDKEWSIWGRGLLRHGVFYVDIEEDAGI